MDDCASLDITHWPVILSDRLLSDGRHIVLGDNGGPHHLWIRDPRAGQSLAYVIPRNAAMGPRVAATERFDRRLSGTPAYCCQSLSLPTAFQAQRFSLLLAILDTLLDAGKARPSTHEIASQLIYPHMTIGRGGEWKASSERRRTQRLIDEALALMNGGYRNLLQGRSAGATKTLRPK
ncbi:DUF2285 domain-containing protein [Novosphingobium sp. BW1]|nr:DUF2285 domain-containing protein [Novosphingobium sp. BW1]